MTAIREMSPYITRFMEEQFGGEQNANGEGNTDNNNEGADLRPDNGLGGQTSDEAGNANAPGDLAGGQSETANETGSGEQTTSASDETGTESGSSTGPKSGSDEQASSDVRDTSDGGNTFTPAPRNFHVTDELDFGKSFSQKTRARQNIAALRLLQKLDEEGRLATPEEQKILAGYVGWGGIPQIFDARRSEWAREYQELKDLLPQDEYEKARRSIQDAHFTSKPVVNAIWAGLQRMGFTNGAVLEPSMGTGNFFGLMPRGMESRSQLTGVELDPLTAKIAQHLYPQAAIYNKGFQEFYVPANSQDAAIGNPPFGAQTLRDATSKELSKLKIHGYFFAKSINAVRPGGLLGMVVSDGFLDARDSQAQAARQYVSDRARLVGAIRLPNTAFKGNAGTEVTTDIIFLQRIDPTNGIKSNPEQWLNVAHMDDEATGEPIPVNQYFVDNPGQLLGKMALTGTMYGPNQPTLEAREGQDLEEDLAKAILALPQNIITDTLSLFELLLLW
jgi:adenine-specific DNA methylase